MAEKYGVDTLRMAIMFGAPPENDLNFDEKSIQSMKSYLDRVSRLGDKLVSMLKLEKLQVKESCLENNSDFLQILKLLQDYELKISEQRYFHVAIARLMEITNILQKIANRDAGSDDKELATLINGYILLIKGLHPFSPHLSSEIWSNLSNSLRDLDNDRIQLVDGLK